MSNTIRRMRLASVSLITGTMFLMWLGEQITERGIGNGISLIITIGIIARYPTDMLNTWRALSLGQMSPFKFAKKVEAGARFFQTQAVYDMDPSIDVSSLGSDIMVAESVLEERGWAVGDTVDVEYAATGVVPTEIAGTFGDQTFANYIVSTETYLANIPVEQIAIAFASGLTRRMKSRLRLMPLAVAR